jgi:Fe-S-cluster containining protein
MPTSLKVIQPPQHEPAPPWYGGGLRFTCTQCGNCCTGGPGYVWISRKEIDRLAGHLKISAQETIEKYCRRVGDKYSLAETRNSRGEHDCIFLKEEKTPPGKNGSVVYTKRVCTIYNYRPLQCRTWPFWEGTLMSPQAWRNAAERCHGMNFGSRIFTREQIEALRDAKEWPKNAPTSTVNRDAPAKRGAQRKRP